MKEKGEEKGTSKEYLEDKDAKAVLDVVGKATCSWIQRH
jgi:hypothetical protein